MKWVIVRRTRKSMGKVYLYNEKNLSPDGTFNDYANQDVVTFPTKEQAQFVANGFELSENVEYIVKPL